MRRLPPLTAVEAFVQVARLGSVKAAAEELALSSPALSRRVQAMERFIGRPLFARRHQSMLLNSDGEMLLSRIAPALDSLGEAIEQVTGEAEIMRLKLGVLPLYGRRLGRNRIVAIGNRSLLEKMGDKAQPADLAQATILLHRDMQENFALWRQAVGMPGLEPRAIDLFDSGQLMLESAAEGLGVAFMLDFHLEGATDPRLVKLFSDEAESESSYWFVCRKASLSRRPVRLFHDWLVGDGEQQ